MKRKVYEIAGDKAFRVHHMAEALRYLASNFMSQGTHERDELAMVGLSYILEHISDEARAASLLLDTSKEEDLMAEIKDPDRYDSKRSWREDIEELIKAAKEKDLN